MYNTNNKLKIVSDVEDLSFDEDKPSRESLIKEQAYNASSCE